MEESSINKIPSYLIINLDFYFFYFFYFYFLLLLFFFFFLGGPPSQMPMTPSIHHVEFLFVINERLALYWACYYYVTLFIHLYNSSPYVRVFHVHSRLSIQLARLLIVMPSSDQTCSKQNSVFLSLVCFLEVDIEKKLTFWRSNTSGNTCRKKVQLLSLTRIVCTFLASGSSMIVCLSIIFSLSCWTFAQCNTFFYMPFMFNCVPNCLLYIVMILGLFDVAFCIVLFYYLYTFCSCKVLLYFCRSKLYFCPSNDFY